MSDHKFFADVGFTKAAESPTGDLKLVGYASAWSLDRDNEYVEPAAFDGSLEKYLAKNPVLLWQHDLNKPIGMVEHASVDEHGLSVRAHVPSPGEREPDWAHLAYSKIKSGIVKTFSIGGLFERKMKGSRKVISGIDLFEISVVSVPSNPDSIFAAAVKSLQGSARPELLAQHVSQMKQLLGIEPFADPELASMDDDERAERYKEIAAVYRKVGKLPPGYESFRDLQAEFENRNGLDGTLERAGKLATLIKRVQGYEPAADLKQASPDAVDAITDAWESVESSMESAEDAAEAFEAVILGTLGIDLDANDPDADEDEGPEQTPPLAGMAPTYLAATILRKQARVLRREAKAGRAISRANEAKLRNAFTAIQEVLAVLDKAPEADAEEPEDPATTIAHALTGSGKD